MSLLEFTMLERLPTLREVFQLLLRKGGPMKKLQCMWKGQRSSCRNSCSLS